MYNDNIRYYNNLVTTNDPTRTSPNNLFTTARNNEFRQWKQILGQIVFERSIWQWQQYYNTYIVIGVESIGTRNYTAIGVAVRSGW